ncbi:P-loop containing nucleoside triphosphate hydrolase protein [Blastocladiella britannica]|nr:P-loop containing nucleoside triphosphate hydrolase protein [Blastocladiella britannica]
MHFAVTPGSTAAGAAGKPEERKWWQGAPKPIRRKVLDDLYFSVRRNEAFAYLGPNGSGKSTTINILTGLLRPSEGCATVCGYPVTTANYDPAIKRLIGVCQQADMVFETLTVREHLEYFAAIKGVADIPSAVTTALSDMALEPVANVHSKALSGGNRRRLSIALACLGRPQVVILDEPTTGVDVATRRTIWTSILALKKHTSVILVTHSLDEADALCDRVGIMINGSLVCLGTPQRLKNLYGASYKVVLRTATPAGGAMAARALQDQFPTATKIDSQVGCNLDLEVDLAKLEVDLGMSQHQPPRGSSLPKGAGHAARLQLADGRVVLADADVANRNSVTAAFLGAVFEAVATRGRTEWGVKDWSVAQTSLSEVFVRLARYHKSHLEEERAAAAGWEEN